MSARMSGVRIGVCCCHPGRYRPWSRSLSPARPARADDRRSGPQHVPASGRGRLHRPAHRQRHLGALSGAACHDGVRRRIACGSRSYYRLETAMRDLYGYRSLIPTNQGAGFFSRPNAALTSRSAPYRAVRTNRESVVAQTARASSILAGGMHLDSIRFTRRSGSSSDSRTPRSRSGRARGRSQSA